MDRLVLTQGRLKEILFYDSRVGVFTWLACRKRCLVGTRAGHVAADGYRRIKIGIHSYKASRLAWFYVYGAWPNGLIDHINLSRNDDRMINLRIASFQQNCCNRPVNLNNRLGVKGVCQVGDRFQANIVVNRKTLFLGRFETVEEASMAYTAAAIRYFGEFARVA